jgi:hypothetical protein
MYATLKKLGPILISVCLLSLFLFFWNLIWLSQQKDVSKINTERTYYEFQQSMQQSSQLMKQLLQQQQLSNEDIKRLLALVASEYNSNNIKSASDPYTVAESYIPSRTVIPLLLFTYNRANYLNMTLTRLFQ